LEEPRRTPVRQSSNGWLGESSEAQLHLPIEIRDPIHGFIKFSSIETNVINTRAFQRLRRIRQLALASLVYPGALHTRFEHSLGVMHLAGRLYDQVMRHRSDSEELRAVRLAALLHDIGHGPFSHVSESVLKRHSKKAKERASRTEEIHEALTCDLIEQCDELSSLLDRTTMKLVIDLLSGRCGDKTLTGIITGPLDADKLDYLLRDSYYCGVKYGVYDLDRLVSTYTRPNDDGDAGIAISRDGVHSLEQFIMAKYYMTTQVYRHRLRLITDSMIIRGLSLGISEDRIEFLQQLYSYDGSKEHLDVWVKWDDESLVHEICTRWEKTLACEIFTRLRERRLFKQIYNEKLNILEDPVLRDRLSGEFETYRDTLEEKVGDLLGTDPRFVIAHLYSIQSIRELSGREEGNVLVDQANDGHPVPFHQKSTLFGPIDAAQKEQYLDFYAPVEYKDEIDKRKRLSEYRDQINSIVTGVLNSNSIGGVDANES